MGRRHEFDWLRVILFGLLVPHHAAVGFVGFGEPIYGFVNDRLAPRGGLTELGIYWSHSWRLPSLFLIAGIGTWFATRRSAGAEWLGRRMAWLLVPALFGAFVLNVLAGFLIFRLTGVPRALPAFWPDWIETAHPPRIMHLWFLVNVAVYTFLLWPFLGLRDRLEGPGCRPRRGLARSRRWRRQWRCSASPMPRDLRGTATSSRGISPSSSAAS
jgi:glucans biosynthesis protein C